MNRLRIMRLRINNRSEDGIAMVSVIAVGAVLAMLMVAGIAFSLGGMNKARSDQDWNGALAAAYAAVEEYQSQLSNDPSYVRFGNPASTYTSYVDPANPTVVSDVSLPPVANDAFGLGPTGAWADVAGSDGTAQYRYEVNNSTYYTDGIITIRATGRVGDTTRSLVADLKQSGFVDYVYFTNLETSDPYDPDSDCNLYAYNGRPSSCGEINFGSGDVVDGPVHSNDRMVIECGATFRKAVSTGFNPASGDRYKQVGSSCTPNFYQNIKPTYGGVIDFPPTNAEMKKEVRYDLPTEVPVAGCLYTGPTSITFTNDGYMQVRSPWTQKVQISATTGRDNASACGLPGTTSDRLGDSNGARVKVPNNNLIFVQNVPTVVGDPNYRSSGVSMGGCSGTQNKNPLGYPVSGETAPTGAYLCRSGDVFVKGVLEGKVTIAAENNVYIVHDITYEDRDRDALGLVGQNAVIVWNPADKDNGPYYSGGMKYWTGDCISSYCDQNRDIHAAILSVAHTFTVQNYDVRYGFYRGDLRVYGSIAQQFRGIVRWQSGFNKDYEYDKKFMYTAPPKFLTPASTTYGVSTWIEINPVFDADGTYR